MAPVKHQIEIHKREVPGNCGPAAMKMALGRYGIHRTERYLQRILKTDPDSIGTTAENMVAVFHKYGLEAEILDNCAFEDLEDRIHGRNGHGARPVIVNWWLDSASYGHYSLLCDIQLYDGDVCLVFADPSYARHRWYTRERFLQLWFDYKSFFPPSLNDFVFHRMIDFWKE